MIAKRQEAGKTILPFAHLLHRHSNGLQELQRNAPLHRTMRILDEELLQMSLIFKVWKIEHFFVC